MKIEKYWFSGDTEYLPQWQIETDEFTLTCSHEFESNNNKLSEIEIHLESKCNKEDQTYLYWPINNLTPKQMDEKFWKSICYFISSECDFYDEDENPFGYVPGLKYHCFDENGNLILKSDVIIEQEEIFREKAKSPQIQGMISTMIKNQTEMLNKRGFE